MPHNSRTGSFYCMDLLQKQFAVFVAIAFQADE